MAGSSSNVSSILPPKALPDPLAFMPPHFAFQVKFSELVIASSLAVRLSIRLVKLGADLMWLRF